jgi:hypothetical protein
LTLHRKTNSNRIKYNRINQTKNVLNLLIL